MRYGVRVKRNGIREIRECESLAEAEALVVELGLPWRRLVGWSGDRWRSLFPDLGEYEDHPDDGAPSDWRGG